MRGALALWSRLVSELLLGHVAQAAAFDEAKKFFRQIRRVISGTLQRLRNQKQVGMVLRFFLVFRLKVPAKKRFVNLVNFAIGTQNVTRGIQFAPGKSLTYLLQHFLQNFDDGDEVFGIRLGQLGSQVVHALTDPPEEIANALQFRAEAQTGEQFTRLWLRHIGDCAREPLINFLFNAVQFFFAIADRQVCHP